MSEAYTFDVDARVRLGAHTLSFKLATAARCIGIMGASGSGKSTFLRLLAGLLRNPEGRIAVAGTTWLDTARSEYLPAWKRGVGWCPQDSLLLPHKRVEENLSFGNFNTDAQERVLEFLDIRHLLSRSPRHLSGGERQRVALGRALLCRPRILLLDEPFSAQDRELRVRLSSHVANFIRSEAIPTVLVTHDTEAHAGFAEETWTLAAGALQRAQATHAQSTQ